MIPTTNPPLGSPPRVVGGGGTVWMRDQGRLKPPSAPSPMPVDTKIPNVSGGGGTVWMRDQGRLNPPSIPKSSPASNPTPVVNQVKPVLERSASSNNIQSFPRKPLIGKGTLQSSLINKKPATSTYPTPRTPQKLPVTKLPSKNNISTPRGQIGQGANLSLQLGAVVGAITIGGTALSGGDVGQATSSVAGSLAGGQIGGIIGGGLAVSFGLPPQLGYAVGYGIGSYGGGAVANAIYNQGQRALGFRDPDLVPDNFSYQTGTTQSRTLTGFYMIASSYKIIRPSDGAVAGSGGGLAVNKTTFINRTKFTLSPVYDSIISRNGADFKTTVRVYLPESDQRSPGWYADQSQTWRPGTYEIPLNQPPVEVPQQVNQTINIFNYPAPLTNTGTGNKTFNFPPTQRPVTQNNNRANTPTPLLKDPNQGLTPSDPNRDTSKPNQDIVQRQTYTDEKGNTVVISKDKNGNITLSSENGATIDPNSDFVTGALNDFSKNNRGDQTDNPSTGLVAEKEIEGEKIRSNNDAPIRQKEKSKDYFIYDGKEAGQIIYNYGPDGQVVSYFYRYAEGGNSELIGGAPPGTPPPPKPTVASSTIQRDSKGNISFRVTTYSNGSVSIQASDPQQAASLQARYAKNNDNVTFEKIETNQELIDKAFSNSTGLTPKINNQIITQNNTTTTNGNAVSNVTQNQNQTGTNAVNQVINPPVQTPAPTESRSDNTQIQKDILKRNVEIVNMLALGTGAVWLASQFAGVNNSVNGINSTIQNQPSPCQWPSDRGTVIGNQTTANTTLGVITNTQLVGINSTTQSTNTIVTATQTTANTISTNVTNMANVIGTATSTATNTLFGFMKSFSKSIHLDKIYNAMGLILQIHNAAMLSRNLAESLSFLIDGGLNILGLKDEEGEPLNIGQTISNGATNLIKSIIGENTYNGVNSAWKKLSAIYTATVNIYQLMLNNMAGIAEGLEIVGNYTGKIGNALKRGGTVLENAYQWMDENITVKTGRLGVIERVSQGLQDATEVTDNLTEVTEIVQETTESISTVQTEVDNIKEILDQNEKDKETEQTESKAVSKAPDIQDSDLIPPSPN